MVSFTPYVTVMPSSYQASGPLLEPGSRGSNMIQDPTLTARQMYELRKLINAGKWNSAVDLYESYGGVIKFEKDTTFNDLSSGVKSSLNKVSEAADPLLDWFKRNGSQIAQDNLWTAQSTRELLSQLNKQQHDWDVEAREWNAQQAAIDRLFQQNSADRAMKFSAEQANRQMGFQETMSNTAYQRAVADLKAAGLNPILAYSQGGASALSGAAASGSSASGSRASTSASSVKISQLTSNLSDLINAAGKIFSLL